MNTSILYRVLRKITKKNILWQCPLVGSTARLSLPKLKRVLEAYVQHIIDRRERACAFLFSYQLDDLVD